MIRFIAHFLFVLAAWTVVIKYLFPIGYALAQGAPPFTYVLLDFWPAVHVWVGWSLLHWSRLTLPLAATVSVAEIIIVVTKFVLFLAAPEWTIWRTNWFINKIFVLIAFVLLLGYIVLNAGRLRQLAGPQPGRQLKIRPGDASRRG